MDSPVLDELLIALPELATRLQNTATRFHVHENSSSSSIAPVNPCGPERPEKPGLATRRQPPSAVVEEVSKKSSDVGAKKLNAKPGAAKAKFSSITGPDIYYDGDSQQCLFDCWTQLNSKRGFLRKEMMLIKRRKVLTLPSAAYGYSDSEDEDDLEADDDDQEEETEEDRLRRLEEEREEARRKAEEEKKKKEQEKKAALFEEIDNFLDKAAKACESAAFLWLKGDGCAGHVVYITARMQDAIDRIMREKLVVDEVPVDEDDDEGFGDELEELPHKKPAHQRPDPEPDHAHNLQPPQPPDSS